MANGKQSSQKGAEEILDIIDSYIDVKEAVELFKKKPLGYEMKPELEIYKDGFNDGYNKANEWHFVSKEGHPNKDDIYLTIRKDGLHLGDYCQGGDGDIDCQSWCDYPSEEEIQDDSVIAWKEIVPPKESK